MPKAVEQFQPYWQSADGRHKIYWGDCRDIIPNIRRVDAVVTDPPYGIGASRYGRGGTQHGASLAKCRVYEAASWDDATVPQDLMDSILATAHWAIIFGGNYYPLPPTRCWLVWDKENGDNEYADCELAWTNLDKATRLIRYMWHGMLRANGEQRGDHPTQKPVGVMKWAIGHLPANAHIILDPFMGSGTTGVACAQLDRLFIGIEQEKKYADAAVRRMEKETMPTEERRKRLELAMIPPALKPIQFKTRS